MMPLMTEIVFIVHDDPEGGFAASAVQASIHTQAATLAELREAIRDAVRCHFDGEESMPSVIRLHYVRDEVIAA